MTSKSIIALVVMVLAVVVVAIPVMSGVHFYDQELNADPDYRFSTYNGETLEFVYSSETLTLNGESFASLSALFISEFYYVSNTHVVDFESDVAIPWADGDTLTISHGAVTGTGSMSSASVNLGSNAIYVDPDGNLGRYNSSAYIDKNAKVYTYYTNHPCMFAAGTAADGFTVLHSGKFDTTTVEDVALTDVSMNITETDNGAILVNAVSFTKSGSETSTNTFFIIPIEYQVEVDGGTTGQIVDVIPVLLVISLLVFAAMAFLRRA